MSKIKKAQHYTLPGELVRKVSKIISSARNLAVDLESSIEEADAHPADIWAVVLRSTKDGSVESPYRPYMVSAGREQEAIDILHQEYPGCAVLLADKEFIMNQPDLSLGASDFGAPLKLPKKKRHT